MLEKHGVTLEEAIEAAESTYVHNPGRPAPESQPASLGGRRYIIPGKTDTGRRLWVVVAYEGQGRARLVTAYEPLTEHDRAQHRRFRGD
jgi:hypothetical protein